MDDLKELIDHPSCYWGYIDELRMAIAAACKERDELKKQLHESKLELNAMRNELCFKCRNYREAHNGACDGCRWEKAALKDGHCDFGFSRENIRELLQDIPAIDAVPVVRCRECKHLNVVNRKELYAHCPKTNTVFLPFELDTREHFCSLGERKEGAE